MSFVVLVQTGEDHSIQAGFSLLTDCLGDYKQYGLYLASKYVFNTFT